jgi:hypothetical protein
MGVSVVLKVKSELRNIVDRKLLLWKITQRSCFLICLGIIVTNLGNDDLSTLRIPGVLQRLGVAYFVVGALETTFMTPQPESEVRSSCRQKTSNFYECSRVHFLLFPLEYKVFRSRGMLETVDGHLYADCHAHVYNIPIAGTVLSYRVFRPRRGI